MPILFRESPNIDHFRRATIRSLVPMEKEELDANVIVVDDELHAEWLQLVPGQQALPLAAPRQGVSIVCCTQENGLTAGGDRMVTVWWFPMETTSQEPAAGDPWTPLRAPGPTSGADQSNVIFIIYALLYSTLTTFARSVIILIFEVVIFDCPKSWSGLLALGAARVLGIQDAEAYITFLCTAEMLFTEMDGIVWADEPQLRFFIDFLHAALRANVPVVVAAVHEHAEKMQMSKTAAVEYLAGQFQVEARWLAAAGAPIYEPLRWIIRKTPRPQAAFAWTKIRNVLADHELPWAVALMERRAAECNHDFWWRGQGGGVQEREQVKTNWTNRAQAKLTCPSGASNCHGRFSNWSMLCKVCRQDPEVYIRDPCLAKFDSGSGTTCCEGPKDFSESWWHHMCKVCRQDPEVYIRDPCSAKTDRGYGVSGCNGPNSTRGIKCRTCSGSTVDKRKREGGPSVQGSLVRSALQLSNCPGCGRQVKVCRAALRDNRPPKGKVVVCQECYM